MQTTYFDTADTWIGLVLCDASTRTYLFVSCTLKTVNDVSKKSSPTLYIIFIHEFLLQFVAKIVLNVAETSTQSHFQNNIALQTQ